MTKTLTCAALALLAVACSTSNTPTPTAATPMTASPRVPVPAPPPSDTRTVTETLNGMTVTDQYRWLEDQNAPDTRSWINRQNAYTDSVMTLAPSRGALVKRYTELLTVDQMSTPIVRGSRYFFTKRPAGQDVFAIYMRDGVSGADRLLVDPAPMSENHTTNVGIEDISFDGKMLAYYVRRGGADETEVHFLDVDGRHDVGAVLPLARYEGLSITADHASVFYTRFLPEGGRVFRRPIAGGDEEKLFGDGYTPDKILSSELSEDGKWLLIHVSHGSAGKKTEIYVKNVRDNGPLQPVVNDLDAWSTASIGGDTLVIDTNWNAPNRHVFTVDANDPKRGNWKEIIPENKSAAIQSVSLVGGRVYVRYLENVKPRVVGFGLDGTRHDEIAFDAIGTVNNISGSWGSPTAFYSFASFNVPSTIYSYDIPTGNRTVFFRSSVPVNPDDFTVEQVWYPSKDGTRIPMFLMYKKGLQRNGTSPAYLTAYGGFNVSEVPAFSARGIVWAENGGVYAMANLRGGGEFGETWHRAGMGANKQNVFDDFAGAAQFLAREHYSSPEHIAVAGTSNGGLLVMAMTTQHPELVRAVYCGYPLVDMLRFHKFLVGSFWVPEYGSPDDPAEFGPIYAYSPYQHVVKRTKYPAVMFVTGDADTRVAPLHARKMTALLQAANTGENPIVLRYHTSGGHSGGEPLNEQVKNETESIDFLLWQTR